MAAVQDGETAVGPAVVAAPDVAAVDVRMPGESDLVTALPCEAPGIRVIVLSADASEGLRAQMLRAGASAYLVKGCPDLDLSPPSKDVQRQGELAAKLVVGAAAGEPVTSAIVPTTLVPRWSTAPPPGR